MLTQQTNELAAVVVQQDTQADRCTKPSRAVVLDDHGRISLFVNGHHVSLRGPDRQERPGMLIARRFETQHFAFGQSAEILRKGQLHHVIVNRVVQAVVPWLLAQKVMLPPPPEPSEELAELLLPPHGFLVYVRL
ncbi:MAG: hypothetical protein M3021_05375 [Actinomycetota bacterium]|nr:hypothetical protein [Actinomycetota bacterium]